MFVKYLFDLFGCFVWLKTAKCFKHLAVFEHWNLFVSEIPNQI